jgi:hypothetical protein
LAHQGALPHELGKEDLKPELFELGEEAMVSLVVGFAVI